MAELPIRWGLQSVVIREPTKTPNGENKEVANKFKGKDKEAPQTEMGKEKNGVQVSDQKKR